LERKDGTGASGAQIHDAVAIEGLKDRFQFVNHRRIRIEDASGKLKDIGEHVPPRMRKPLQIMELKQLKSFHNIKLH
jgi:hypothetical protein